MDRNNYVSLELPFDRVALRKESVDRNAETMLYGSYKAGRSPQGERG